MPVQIPKPVLIVKMVGKDTSSYFSNTLYYDITGGSTFTQSNIDAIGVSVADSLGDPWRQLMSEDAQIVHWYVRWRSTTQDLETYVTTGAGIGNGSMDGECMPAATCLEIQRRTGKPGRNMRGRIFVSGLSEKYGESGLLDASQDTVGAAQALATALGTDLTSTTFTMHARHWNRKTNTLEVVTQCRPMFPLVTRHDRRGLHNLQPF